MCYRCEAVGHKAQECDGASKCPVCSDLGRPANHRAGNKACTSAYSKRRAGLTFKGSTRKTTQEAVPETTRKNTQEVAGSVPETTREQQDNVEMRDVTEEITEQPKPQRIRKRPTETTLVDKAVEEQQQGDTQEQRDRE